MYEKRTDNIQIFDAAPYNPAVRLMVRRIGYSSLVKKKFCGLTAARC